MSGLSCARVLQQRGISFALLEKTDRPGGRVKTDRVAGFLLDHGFQVLQTGYPDLSARLDLQQLDLSPFPAGVAVRCDKRFHIVADPRQHPKNILSTTAAPIGSLADRLRLLGLVRSLLKHPLEHIFTEPEEPAIDYLRHLGFSERFIHCFFSPFFAGACLDPGMQGSSRVLKYVSRVFATGSASLPAAGMEAIPRQLAASLPEQSIRCNQEVTKVEEGVVTLADGSTMGAQHIVLAVSEPVCAELLGFDPSADSVGEACVYFSSEWRPPLPQPFLVLNGDGRGPVNNIAFPSLIAPSYAPPGKTLIAAVVLGEEFLHSTDLEDQVREQCRDWFGDDVQSWEHLKTMSIQHALPTQAPPTSNPYEMPPPYSDKILICGEYQSLPGLLWALLSGEMAGRHLVESFARNA